MGGLRKLMKRRKETTVTRNILSLPRDMLASILASVASSSVIDLVEAKRTCQGFYEAASDYLVFRRVTLESVYGTSWTANSPEKSSFLKQCEEMGNPDALCNLGMYHFFSYREYELGLNLLKKCVDSGHLYSSYALGMILLSNRGSHLEAIEVLNKIENLETDKYRRRFRKILNRMWIHYSFSKEESTCKNSLCRNGGKRGLPCKEEWSREEEDWFCSEDCKWGFEYNMLCNRLFNCHYF